MSTLQVDAIKKTNGSVPTLADLSINHTGSIIQTVFAAGSSTSKGFGSDTVYNSSTYTDIDSSTLSITPSSTSSKILILAQNHFYVTELTTDAWRGVLVKILRDSTAISTDDSGYGFAWYTTDNTNRAMEHMTRQVIDSPSTTSAITYKCQVASKVNSHACYVNKLDYGSGGHLMAMEIAG